MGGAKLHRAAGGSGGCLHRIAGNAGVEPFLISKLADAVWLVSLEPTLTSFRLETDSTEAWPIREPKDRALPWPSVDLEEISRVTLFPFTVYAVWISPLDRAGAN